MLLLSAAAVAQVFEVGLPMLQELSIERLGRVRQRLSALGARNFNPDAGVVMVVGKCTNARAGYEYAKGRARRAGRRTRDTARRRFDGRARGQRRALRAAFFLAAFFRADPRGLAARVGRGGVVMKMVT